MTPLELNRALSRLLLQGEILLHARKKGGTIIMLNYPDPESNKEHIRQDKTRKE
jgi:hypothetical protein